MSTGVLGVFASIRGETFKDAVDAWKKDVAPQLSPATVKQRESYLRIHILPVFAKSATHALDVRALQGFATSLQNDLSPKTIVNILETVFVVLRYAKRVRDENQGQAWCTIPIAGCSTRPENM